MYAHTVAVIRLHLSKKNNPLLKYPSDAGIIPNVEQNKRVDFDKIAPHIADSLYRNLTGTRKGRQNKMLMVVNLMLNFIKERVSIISLVFLDISKKAASFYSCLLMSRYIYLSTMSKQMVVWGSLILQNNKDFIQIEKQMKLIEV